MDQSKMSRAQQSQNGQNQHQPSIKSFFAPRPAPNYSAPPTGAAVAAVPPPPPPPPPPAALPKAAATENEPIHPLGPAPVRASLPSSVPVLPSPPSLPPQASIVPITEQHIAALRRINTLLLPVHYPDSFYAHALEPLASGLFSRAILWHDDHDGRSSIKTNKEPRVIGGLVCRLEPNPFVARGDKQQPQQQHAIYIQSLTLLSPFRALGLAAAALEHIVVSAALLAATPGSTVDVRAMYAHVWTANEEGLHWYQARGFAPTSREPQPGYYIKLRPDTAWVVRRDIGTGAGAGTNGVAATATAGAPWTQKGNIGNGAFTHTAPAPTSTLAEVVNLPSMNGPPGVPPKRPQASPLAPSPSPTPSLSFQNARPDMEWNDLPEEMVTKNGGGGPGSSGGGALRPSKTAPGSGASSRSSSQARKKKERAYPAAAFGS